MHGFYICSTFLFVLLTSVFGKTIVHKKHHKRYKYAKDTDKNVFLNKWAVIVHGDEHMANQVAKENGFVNKGKVFGNVYEFVHAGIPKRRKRASFVKSIHLRADTRVVIAEQQEVKKRFKRSINFNDKQWKKQWYLYREDFGFSNQHMNVVPVWKKGYTGKGVVVSVLDDGLEHTHPEISPNYDPKASYDFNNNDADPLPTYTWRDENSHGTRCAGQIAAAANNTHCVVGVAYRASIGGIRMLDGEITDIVESQSLSFARDHIDIYSSSWGPADSGDTVDGPGTLTKKALEEGAKFGRKGKGNIVVWASGNGGDKDNCNCDGYTNSIYTISIGAATSIGMRPWYLETCASTLVSAYSTGSSTEFEKRIVSPDYRGGCTEDHTGTSAAQPLVSGFIALALEANPNLTWRDVQHLLVLSSTLKLLDGDDFKYNAAGLQFSHYFGYGVLDGEKLITLAETWPKVPEQHRCINNRVLNGYPANTFNKTHSLELEIKASGCHGTLNFIRYTEHVIVKTTFFHQRRGAAEILIKSPKGTKSWVLREREKDRQSGEFRDWEFLSTHFWGEDPRGIWTVTFFSKDNIGYLDKMSLIIYGTEKKPGVQESNTNNRNFNCHPQCLQDCLGPKDDECISCKTYHYLDKDKKKHCVEDCPVSMFLSADKELCVPCRENCLSCAGNKIGECWLCQKGTTLHNGECLLKCPKGLYSVKNINGFVECRPCGENCAECFGKADNCTKCAKGTIRDGNTCSAKCATNEWLDDETCKACHSTCKSCLGGGTEYNCTLCPKVSLNDVENRFLFQNSQCLKSCPIGTFKENTIEQHCISCPRNCLQCSNEGYKCDVCNVTHYRQATGDGKCVEVCPEGYYTDVVRRMCEPCDLQCSKCVPGNPSACISCMDGFYLKGHECVAATECQTRYYVNETTKRCEFCPDNCSFCVSATRCTVCELNYFLTSDDKCVERCPSGSYALDRQTTCGQCFSTCKECQGPASHDCTACPNNRYLFNGRCVLTIPKGYYAEKISDTKICKPCHYTCQECKGPKPTDCTKCLDTLDKREKGCINPCVDQWLSENKCESCHPSCQSCYGPLANHCLQCSGNFSLNKESHTCSKVCPRKYYRNKTKFVCERCHHSCASCTGPKANQCLTCPDKLQFHNNTCVLHCPDGWYKTFRQQCEKCSNKCKKCLFKYDLCTDCKEGNVSKNFKCFSNCGKNSFANHRNRCYPCYENCESCFGTGPNQCNSCSPGYTLHKNMCIRGCLPGFYNSSKEKKCLPCSDKCLKCQETRANGTECLLCSNITVLTPHGECHKTCPVGTYHKQFTNACGQCPGTGCATCDSSTCFTCKPLYELSNKICKSTCPKNMFPDSKNKQCKPCHENCMSCYGPTEHDCQRCKTGSLTFIHKIKKISCLDKCPSTFYPDIGICKSCKSPCKSCISDKICKSCYDNLYLFNDTCRKICPVGYYKNSSANVCSKCDTLSYGCLACNSSFCFDCDDGFLPNNGKCLKNCTDGHFSNETHCMNCSLKFQDCNLCNETLCLKCDENYQLINSTCTLVKCSKGYKLLNKTCIKCVNKTCHGNFNKSFLTSSNSSTIALTTVTTPMQVATKDTSEDEKVKNDKEESELFQSAVANISNKKDIIAFDISNSKRSRRSIESTGNNYDSIITMYKNIPTNGVYVTICALFFLALLSFSAYYYKYNKNLKVKSLKIENDMKDNENR